MDETIRKAFITLCVCLFSCAFAKSDKETFLQANKSYEERDFESALNNYSSIDEKNDAVWYNMGNCHYQQGSYAQALVCWNRSLPLSSYSCKDDIICNVDQVRDKCGLPKKNSHLPEWLIKVATTIPLLFLQILFLCVWYLFFMVWFKGAQFKWHFSLTIISFVLSCILGILVIVAYSYQHGKSAIVMSRECVVLSGPHENFDVLDTLFEAEEVEVEHTRNDWLKVKTSRSTGWIPAKHLEVI